MNPTAVTAPITAVTYKSVPNLLVGLSEPPGILDNLCDRSIIRKEREERERERRTDV